MRRPTFLIVGSPKCGTTALSQYLSAHPNVFISKPKEPHFFDSHYQKGMAGYLRDHYADWKCEEAAGEATPSYLLVPYVAARIRQDLPESRLIAILRNPVDRAYSSWWMFHCRGMDPMPFEEAIRDNEKRLSEKPSLWGRKGEDIWQSHVNTLAQGERISIRTYLESGYYAEHLRRYFACFPSDQVKVIFSDDLSRDPVTTVQGLWRFVGVTEDVQLKNLDSVNDAIGPGARPFLQIARLTGAIRLRGFIPDSLKSRIKKRLSSLGNRPPMGSAIRTHLLEHFEPHTSDLEKLLQVDLKHWRR